MFATNAIVSRLQFYKELWERFKLSSDFPRWTAIYRNAFQSYNTNSAAPVCATNFSATFLLGFISIQIQSEIRSKMLFKQIISKIFEKK